ncbi:hypothetical protein ACFV4P_24040 [Kitasatospora sp. NPDC059795]|nr:hypothetical protein [Kitasatospora sp. CB01950]
MADDMNELFDLDVHDLISTESDAAEQASISDLCVTGSCHRPYCI